MGALLHLALVFWAVFWPPEGQPISGLGGWLLLDPLGKLVLAFQSGLFFLCSLYAPGYLALRLDRPNRVFCANLFLMLGIMTLVVLSHHLGLMWVAMEATTLVTAPLIYFNHNARSLEATWKYLLIGSVGIALALLGSFFLAYASLKAGLESTLLFDQLVKDAPRLSAPWLRAAFVLLFIGYGTKMGLAPMHTWKPDAYGEAPGMVGTLLAGGVTSCAFLAILRVYADLRAPAPMPRSPARSWSSWDCCRWPSPRCSWSGSAISSGCWPIPASSTWASWCWASALAAWPFTGPCLHLINNGLTKGVLFLSAGNIHRAYGSKLTDDVQGAIKRVPLIRGPVSGGVSGHHRLSPVWPVRE